MDPITGGLLAAGITAGGSLLASGLSSAFNASQSDKQMDFQEDMANTAHQREVKDLRAAGLNPILSANGGAPAPGGNSARADFENPIAPAVQAMAQMSAIRLQTAQANSAQAQADATHFDTGTRMQTQDNDILMSKLAVINSGLDKETKQKNLLMLDNQMENLVKQRDMMTEQNKLLKYQLPGAYNQAKFEQSQFGKARPYFNMLNPALNSALQAGKFLIPGY